MESITHLPIARIIPGDNDRTEFREAELHELAESIKTHGLAQPITVRPQGDGWQIVAGERRYRAHLILGVETIPAIVRELSDEAAAAVMLAENVHRVDLNAVDEARAYHKRMEQFAWSVAQVAKAANVSDSRIRSRLRLLSLVDDAQLLIQTGQLGVGYGEAMSDLDANRQRIALRYLRETQRPTLSEFRSLCGKLLAEQSQDAMFSLDDFMVEVQQRQEEQAKPKRIPTADWLPPVDGKGAASVADVIERYMVRLLAGDDREREAAHIIGTLYEGLIRTNCARPPKVALLA